MTIRPFQSGKFFSGCDSFDQIVESGSEPGGATGAGSLG